MKKLIMCYAFTLSQLCFPYTLTYREKHVNDSKTTSYIDVLLERNELIYEKEILVSVDNPLVTLSPWKTSTASALSYDPYFKQQRTVFDENFIIEVETSITESEEKPDQKNPITAKLNVIMASNQQRVPKENSFTLSFVHETTLTDIITNPTQIIPAEAQGALQEVEFNWQEWSQSLKEKITATESWSLRLLFVFLLGILLSLTPCIYPMIPITVGILQSQGTTSLLRNFLLSLCYACGLGTTFALMGLLAASSGEAFGHLMGNPIFVCCIVVLLCYFAFSLFGFYQMYIPRFMQGSKQVSKSGSALSIFLFGLASGTFASPCLSPGLALVLALVATMANKLFGFVLLFAFGLGISTPLVIIGTFSSSINMLPRAGMWMLEVQKIFGFLLLSMCFYYLSAILPWYIILTMLTVFFFLIGIYYLQTNPSNIVWKVIKNLVGAFCIIISLFIGVQALHEAYYGQEDPLISLTWQNSYEDAVSQAVEQKKKLFIDFSTPYCSICTAITKTVLQEKDIAKLLQDTYVLLAVDASNNKTEPYKTLRARYDIQGVPTIVIVDPTDGKELKRWTSELYGMEKSLVIGDLKTYA